MCLTAIMTLSTCYWCGSLKGVESQLLTNLVHTAHCVYVHSSTTPFAEASIPSYPCRLSTTPKFPLGYKLWLGDQARNVPTLEETLVQKTLHSYIPWQYSRSISAGEAAQPLGPWSGRGFPEARRRRGSRTVGTPSSWSPGTR